MDSAKLLALVLALKGRTVAVIGDVVADEFIYGRVARVSREAPVLILEYDRTDVRLGGHGRALLEAAEAWARDQGYQEMGSDALIDNLVSHQAHKRSGYIEVDRVVTFRNDLR